MDRTQFLASVASAEPGPGQVLYLERRGEEYAWRPVDDAAAMAVGSPPEDGQPDAWLYFTWPTGGPEPRRAFALDLLAEMESSAGGVDRCRWPLDQPWPHGH